MNWWAAGVSSEEKKKITSAFMSKRFRGQPEGLRVANDIP